MPSAQTVNPKIGGCGSIWTKNKLLQFQDPEIKESYKGPLNVATGIFAVYRATSSTE